MLNSGMSSSAEELVVEHVKRDFFISMPPLLLLINFLYCLVYAQTTHKHCVYQFRIFSFNMHCISFIN